MLRKVLMVMACVLVSGPVVGQDRWNGLDGLKEDIIRNNRTDWLRNYPIEPLPDYRRSNQNREIMQRLDDIDRRLYEMDQERSRRIINRDIR